MSIRKREWTTPKGEHKAAWLVDYRDAAGVRRAKQFARKKDADAFETTASWEVRQGTHTADSQSITVTKAGDNWLARCRRDDLEQSTLNAYGQHLKLHIVPYLGAKRLNQLTTPAVEEFRDTLLDTGRSKAMAKRVLGSLAALIKEAKRVGYVAHNVASGVTVKRSGREKTPVVPPAKEQMRLIIEAASWKGARPMERPLILVLLFAGLRASEVRGLPWRNVNLSAGAITIDQRADFKNIIGPPKSKSGFRTIRIPALVVTALKRWKLQCPPSTLGLVFPSEAGTPIFHANLTTKVIDPLLARAGMVRPKFDSAGAAAMDDDGQPLMESQFSLHDFRHACASMWIEQRVQAKRVQTWMGHHSIQVTFDTYGHLFAALEEDAAVMAALEAGIMGTNEEAAA